ncbi:MAG: hypothetical protein ABL958_15405 [Bdellovibrionia bacterium]
MKDFDLNDVLKKANSTGNLSDIVLGFFASFSKFEFDLIERGFTEMNGSFVEVNWTKFTNWAINSFPDEVLKILDQHLDFLANEPPRKLAIDPVSKRLCWMRSAEEQKMIDKEAFGKHPKHFTDLCIFLKRVRNNLFHGAKYLDEDNLTAARLMECLAVLDSLRKLASRI